MNNILDLDASNRQNTNKFRIISNSAVVKPAGKKFASENSLKPKLRFAKGRGPASLAPASGQIG